MPHLRNLNKIDDEIQVLGNNFVLGARIGITYAVFEWFLKELLTIFFNNEYFYDSLYIFLQFAPLIGVLIILWGPYYWDNFGKFFNVYIMFCVFVVSLIYLDPMNSSIVNSFGQPVTGLKAIFISLTGIIIIFCFIFLAHLPFEEHLDEWFLIYYTWVCLFRLFITDDLIQFYLAFESVVIPLYLLLGIFGSRPRRYHAATQMLFFTLLSGFFMLVAIVIIKVKIGTTKISELSSKYIDLGELKTFICLAFFFTFAVKIPLVPFHIWLPEAHVEAPTTGSVILAALLLKMGHYGVVQILFTICGDTVSKYRQLIIIIITID